MKIYFAGPLFTPYVRSFISEHAQILRDNGIEPFVPHERFNSMISPERVRALVEQGAIGADELGGTFNPEAVMDLVRDGRLTRDQLGLPATTPPMIFETDYAGLVSANAVVAILDGTQVDDGTACEIGIFYAMTRSDPSKKGVVGFITDSRGTRQRARGYGQNMFVLGVIEERGKIVDRFDDVIAQLKAWEAELKAG
jgi:nucleoside 2-deoxyribosyltransferase